MKKVILILLMLSLSFVSCSKKDDKVIEEPNLPDEVPIVDTAYENYYNKLTTSDTRKVAIMIDNDSSASIPQTGINDAFAVYEMMVEGAATRMMAVFLDSDLEKVGPVRSSRHYFLDFVMENDAIYAHCGYSPNAASDINTLGINNINELNSNDGSNFFRDNSKKPPHNLYASIPNLMKTAEKKGYNTKTEKENVFKYSKEENLFENGNVATNITLPYSSIYEVFYEYNSQNGLYERYINKNPHMDAKNDEIITAKNIIVYQAKNYSIDDVGRQNIELVGSGNGYYITNGKAIPITWSKSSRSAKTTYKMENGEELLINAGNTFVQILPLSSQITIE